MKKLIGCIKNVILRHKGNAIRKHSVENVAEKLLASAFATADFLENSLDKSPKRVNIEVALF